MQILYKKKRIFFTFCKGLFTNHAYLPAKKRASLFWALMAVLSKIKTVEGYRHKKNAPEDAFLNC